MKRQEMVWTVEKALIYGMRWDGFGFNLFQSISWFYHKTSVVQKDVDAL